MWLESHFALLKFEQPLTMLKSLAIRNYAIIEQLDISFDAKLNVMTGETGAGKSIVLGALSLILGERATQGVQRNPEEKCVIEGVFQIKAYQLQALFEAEGLDYADETIIRRELLPGGKSRSFVNDTPASLQAVKEIASKLVDLHRQFDTADINSNDYQLMITDAVADNKVLLAKYQAIFSAHNAALKELNLLISQQQQANKDLDFWKFQFNELNEINLEGMDQSALEAEMNTLNHAEEIKSKLLQSEALLNDENWNLLDKLEELNAGIRSILPFQPALGELQQRLESLTIELNDIAKEIQHHQLHTVYDEQRAEELQNMLSLLFKLQKKHAAADVEALLQLKTNLESNISRFENIDSSITAQQQLVDKLKKELQDIGKKLYDTRHKALVKIEKPVTDMLAKVGMPHARFQIAHQLLKEGQFHVNGIDELEYLFSANPGSELKPLKKVASGGELSRLMLCIKSLLADSVALPTLIFDEIDTGISGAVSVKVGEILQEMGKHHQLICITHLPQIAAKGSTHFHIYKEVKAGQTNTRVRKLNDQDRLDEIAAMLGGDKDAKGAQANARELLTSK
jgi:DNA repair protein RecN (Recombination protein N)